MRFEGERGITDVCTRQTTRQALALNAKSVSTSEANGWLEETQKSHGLELQKGVRWSKISKLLEDLELQLPEYETIILDQPALTGCRCKVTTGKKPHRESEQAELANKFIHLIDTQDLP